MLIYVIAGEPSGDMLGARLMRALKELYPEVSFAGLGGENMEKEGLHSLFDITDLAIMGLAEVIPSIPKVLKRLRQTVSDIKEKKPVAVITIDSWSFCSRIHKALRRQKIKTLQIHYVAPQVWAWKKGRAKTMHKYIDRLLTLFPNEPAYFTPYHLQADCVGHPAIESPYIKESPEVFKNKYNISKQEDIVLLLPGSRHNEVSRLLPVFLETAELLKKEYKNLRFVLPTVKTVEKTVRQMLKQRNTKDVLVINNSEDRHLGIRAAKAAMAASGTVSLELAISGIPHLIAYKVSPLTAFIARRFLKIWSVNLPNLIMNERIVPEMLQEECVPEKISKELKKILTSGSSPARLDFLKKTEELNTLLGSGKIYPSQRAAEIILKAIKESDFK